jgi:hypothetical protein
MDKSKCSELVLDRPVGSDPWSEQIPYNLSGGGPIDPGGVFGNGNTGPFIFSYISDVHWNMTYDAGLYVGLRDALAQALATSVVSVDHGTQGTNAQMTHIHAMGAPGEKCGQAYAATVLGSTKISRVRENS